MTSIGAGLWATVLGLPPRTPVTITVLTFVSVASDGAATAAAAGADPSAALAAPHHIVALAIAEPINSNFFLLARSVDCDAPI